MLLAKFIFLYHVCQSDSKSQTIIRIILDRKELKYKN